MLRKYQIPNALKGLLTTKQYKLLKAYLNNSTIKYIVRKLKVKRNDVLLEYIYLGKKLAIYEWLYCKIYAPLNESPEFIRGFGSCKQKFKEKIKDEEIRRASRPNKKSRKKTKS